MRAAYSLFRGNSTESDLAKQMDVGAANNDPTSSAPYFYANLYLGLYAEAKGNDILARKCERVTRLALSINLRLHAMWPVYVTSL